LSVRNFQLFDRKLQLPTLYGFFTNQNTAAACDRQKEMSDIILCGRLQNEHFQTTFRQSKILRERTLLPKALAISVSCDEELTCESIAMLFSLRLVAVRH